MAVNWGSLIFGGVDSSEYGIYLSGEGVYNAPERAVNVVDVPGRNGSVIIDQGHWNNIEVTYKAGVFGADQAGFSEKLSAFRNAILSQTGYQRLSDTYHPEEFRMGAYVSGLDVTPASYNRHGEFELVFNCKPQRWLVDGDLPIPIDSGDVLQNPELYPSNPLISLEGYGNISFNGYTVNLTSDPMGDINVGTTTLYNQTGATVTNAKTFGQYKFLAGDAITIDDINVPRALQTKISIGASDVSGVQLDSGGTFTNPYATFENSLLKFAGDIGTINFTAGTASTQTFSQVITVAYHSSNFKFTVSLTFAYDGDETITVTYSITKTSGDARLSVVSADTDIYYDLHIYSTYPGWLAQYDYVCIDCDLGEVYAYDGSQIVSLNQWVSLGSDLPNLAPGSNTVTFDNTLLNVKISPRWWRL